MKYICPEYKIQQIEADDVITASISFGIIEDKENDKVEYVIMPEIFFGF